MSPVFRHIRVHGSKRNLVTEQFDLILVNFLLWRALLQKLYCQEIQDADYLKRVLLQCWL